MPDPREHEALIQALGDPVCTVDATGAFGYVNGAFERATGYDADTVRGEPLALVFGDDAEQLQQEMAALSDETSQRTLEATLSTRAGDTTPVECTLGLLPDAHEHHATATIHDITRLKRRERRLSKFASVVSHDLRNPLDVAMGRAEVVPEIADVDEETERHLDEIFDALKRMEQLIEEVLTLSRQRDELVEVSTVTLADVATDAWGNVETPDATLTVASSGEFRANRSRLLRLLENLFRNAIAHGGPAVTVTVGMLDTRWDTAETGFYVADDGRGVPAEDREQIFEDGYTTSESGTGLGLTIVEEIARSHDWTVEVTDSESGGARFEISCVSIPNV